MNQKLTIKVNDTPILLNERIVERAMKKLEVTHEFESLRELLDSLLLSWVKA